MTEAWDRIDSTDNGQAFKAWLKNRTITEEIFNGFSLEKINVWRTKFEQQQQQPNEESASDLFQQKAQNYAAKLCELDIEKDPQGESYLDVSESGVFTDQNQIVELNSRKELYEKHPGLKHRLVVFDHYQPLWKEILSFFKQDMSKRVFLVGTPGIGKSSMRNFHAHLILKEAKENKTKCMVVMAKGGKARHVRLSVNEGGVATAQVSSEELDVAVVTTLGYTPGTDFFCLADISNGNVDHVFTEGGLVLYSSPNQQAADEQILKQECCRMGCPLPSKDSLLRYASEEMKDAYEKFGPIPRVVWGLVAVSEHEGRLKEALKNIDEFLGVAAERNYLKGPHQFFYMDVVKQAGTHQFRLNDTPPELVHAPRHVMKIVAEYIVKELLSPGIASQFWMQHKAIDGVLFEEVCLRLLALHPKAIKLKTRNLDHKCQPLRGHLKRNIVELEEEVERKDVNDVLGNVTPEVSTNTKLIVPQSSNYAGLDAALVLSGKPKRTKRRKENDHNVATALLQITRSSNHPVADEDVDKFVYVDKKMKREGVASRNCVLFLVPEYNFNCFKKQKAKTEDKQSDLDTVLQVVGCIMVCRS